VTSENSRYFEHLVESLDTAVSVPFLQVEGDRWRPQANDCHNNVDFWVAHHANCKAVRGWLFWPPNELGQYVFMAHSVIEQGGSLADITPMDPNTHRDTLLFARHPGTEEQFNAMKTVCSQVFYPPMLDGIQESYSPEMLDDAFEQ